MAERPPSRAARASGGALIAGTVLSAAMALVRDWEGTRPAPYRDIVGVWTVCTGETRVAMRRYSRAECDAMLREALAGTYAVAVVAAVPGLQDHPGPFVASISLAYNIGPAAYARSSVARRFNAGDWRGGCDAFLMWNRAGGRRLPGLARRREAERRVCLAGLR